MEYRQLTEYFVDQAENLAMAETELNHPILVGGDIGEASGITVPYAPAGLAFAGGEELLALSLEDLIPDPGGDIVIVNDTGQNIAVVTDQSVADAGIAGQHLTDSGFDVSGFAFCTFESGVTVFYPSTQKLLVTAEAQA